MSVSIVLKGTPIGAWVPVKEGNVTGDVHAYVDQALKGVVLGKNKNYRDKLRFSPLAVLIKENEIIVQYAGEHGDTIQKVIQCEDFVELFENFLSACKDHAEGLENPQAVKSVESGLSNEVRQQLQLEQKVDTAD